jgi:hypothetical protein
LGRGVWGELGDPGPGGGGCMAFLGVHWEPRLGSMLCGTHAGNG